MGRLVLPLGTILLSVFLTVACSEPPNKELHQAQGAIDAARAAGAAVDAPEELKGAGGRADSALACNHAPHSRERARAAAKRAADERATVRSEAEPLLADTAAA